MTPSLARRLASEGIGTGLLLAAIIGSGIMGERLASGNMAVALLANSIATGCALAVLIAILGPVSGAHFNPLVTFAMAARDRLPWRQVPAYVVVQFLAAILGVMAAHFMFAEPLVAPSEKVRVGIHQLWSEFIATFGLMLVIWACVRQRLAAAPAWIAAYITAAYWFTASTSFANPAVTIARCLSDTFAGIRPGDVLGFVGAQAAGAVTGTTIATWLFDRVPGMSEGTDG